MGTNLRPGSLSVFVCRQVQWISVPREQFVDFSIVHWDFRFFQRCQSNYPRDCIKLWRLYRVRSVIVTLGWRDYLPQQDPRRDRETRSDGEAWESPAESSCPTVAQGPPSSDPAYTHSDSGDRDKPYLMIHKIFPITITIYRIYSGDCVELLLPCNSRLYSELFSGKFLDSRWRQIEFEDFFISSFLPC